MGQVRSWAETNVGAVRKHNEDNMLSRPDLGLWVVADGAGGHDSGEVASGMIVAELDRLPKHLSGAEVLAEVRLTLARVHAALREEAAAATLLALPVATWTGFLAQAHLARHVLEYSSTAALVISPFGALHAAGAGLAASYAVQALCALACLALAITAARRNPGAGGIALLAAASLVATPYAMDYDLAVAMVPAVWLIAEAQRHGWRAWEKLTLATLYVLPLFARATVILTGFQPAPLVLAALLVLVWRRAITQPQPCAPGAAGIGSAGTDAHGPSRRLTHTVPKQRSTV